MTANDQCPDALLPDGDRCPRCGGRRGPSGVDGGSWVHLQEVPATAPYSAIQPGFDATLDERVERHLLGDSEWTTMELWDQASVCPYADQRGRLLGRLAALLELSPC